MRTGGKVLFGHHIYTILRQFDSVMRIVARTRNYITPYFFTKVGFF